MPDGEVLQDSIAIVDYQEVLHPEVPAFPETPQQQPRAWCGSVRVVDELVVR
jgi:glutathione S-transferase